MCVCVCVYIYIYKNMSSAYNGNFTSSNLDVFSSLSCLISVARISSTMLNRVGMLVFYQILTRLSAFHHYYVGFELVINSFYYVEVCSLHIHFGKSV